MKWDEILKKKKSEETEKKNLLLKEALKKQTFVKLKEVILKQLGEEFENKYNSLDKQIKQKKEERDNDGLRDFEKNEIEIILIELEKQKEEMDERIKEKIKENISEYVNMKEEAPSDKISIGSKNDILANWERIKNQKNTSVDEEVVDREETETSEIGTSEAAEIQVVVPQTENSKSEMTETEKRIYEIEKQIRDAEYKLAHRKDLSSGVIEVLKRSIATLEKEKTRLEEEMKKKDVEVTESSPKDRKEEGETISVASKPRKEREMSEKEKAYDAMIEEIRKGERNLEIKTDENVRQATQTGIATLKREKERLQMEEIAELLKAYDKSKRISEERIKRARENLDVRIEGKADREIIQRIRKSIVKAEMNLDEREARIEEKIRALMEEGNSEYAEKIIREYIERNEDTTGKKKTASEEVVTQEIVGKLEGETTVDRMKRVIRGYVRTSAKLGRTELAQGTRYNLKQFGHRVTDKFFYGMQILGEASKEIVHEGKELIDVDIKNISAIGHDINKRVAPQFEKMKQRKIVGKVIKVADNVSGKAIEIAKDMSEKEKVKEFRRNVKKLGADFKHDAQEFGADFKKTAAEAKKDAPKVIKQSLHKKLDTFFYVKQKAERMAEPLSQDMKYSKAQADYKREGKKVYRKQIISTTKQSILTTRQNISGYLKGMKDKIFKKVKMLSPITINHDAKSVQAMEKATEAIKEASKRTIRDVADRGRNTASALVNKLGDNIEVRTQVNEQKLQQKQEEWERDERCK